MIDDSQEYTETVNENGRTVIHNAENETVSVSDDGTIIFRDKGGNNAVKDVDGNVIEKAIKNTEAEKNSVIIFAVAGAAAVIIISAVTVILVKRKKRG